MTATLIAKFLSEAKFNPKIPGPLAAMLESKDTNYLPLRAIELIREAQISSKISDKQRCLKLAIQLLAMTQAILKDGEPKKKEECGVSFGWSAANIRMNCSKAKGHRGKHSHTDLTTQKKYVESVDSQITRDDE